MVRTGRTGLVIKQVEIIKLSDVLDSEYRIFLVTNKKAVKRKHLGRY